MKPSDILFRAKLLNNDYRHGEPVPKGTWFTGWYYQLQLATEAQHRLVLPREKGFQGQSEMDIDPDTLCQFTGLHDANGTPIFEGDIFTVNGHYPKKIEFRPEHAAFCMANLDKLDKPYLEPWQRIRPDWWNDYKREIRIIGNVFDNPELLKQQS